MKRKEDSRITRLRKWAVFMDLFERHMAVTMSIIEESNKVTLVVGWALGKGLLLSEAREFAAFIVNETDLLQ